MNDFTNIRYETEPAGVRVKPSEWHRAGEECILLYTLKQDGWRRGEPMMVNDITIRIENANGSSNDLATIADVVLSALTEQQGEDHGRYLSRDDYAASDEGQPLDADSPPPSNPVISDEMVEQVFQAVAPHIAGTDWREVRAALTAALSVKPQSGENG